MRFGTYGLIGILEQRQKDLPNDRRALPSSNSRCSQELKAEEAESKMAGNLGDALASSFGNNKARRFQR
jgi:hypothetical protein